MWIFTTVVWNSDTISLGLNSYIKSLVLFLMDRCGTRIRIPDKYLYVRELASFPFLVFYPLSF